MTALQIANLALLKLKAYSLSTFNDEGYVAALCRTYLSHISDQIALERDWRFARKRAELSENTTVTNNTDYDNVYDLPDDCIMPRDLKSGSDWMVEEGYLYTNDDSPMLIYTAHFMEMVDDDADGTTPEVPQIVTGIHIPPLLEDAIASFLAATLAPKITESLQLKQMLSQEAAGALLRAKQHDAKLREPNIEPAEVWADV